MSDKKRGRPKKTTSDLPTDWEQSILNIYSQGGCDVEVRSFLDGMSDDLFYRLLKEDENFSRTIKRGRTHAEAWWREQGRKGLAAGRINTGLYAINMRNRFNWYDANKQGESIDNMEKKLDVLVDEIKKSDTNSD